MSLRHVRHPLSAIFGDMPEPALLALADDIKEKGILEPVVLYDGQVLDGWHRCKAGQIAGVEIPYMEYEGDDPGGFVISKNLHRRQAPLTAAQRAAITVKCREWRPRGVSRPSAPGAYGAGLTEKEMAEEAEVSVRTIRQAKRAQGAGLGDAVAKGEISAKAAEQKVREANGAASIPPRKSPLEKAQERIAELEAELAEEREKKLELIDTLQSYLDSELSEDEQRIEFEKKNRYISTLESQVREHQERANAFMRECNALRKRLGVK